MIKINKNTSFTKNTNEYFVFSHKNKGFTLLLLNGLLTKFLN